MNPKFKAKELVNLFYNRIDSEKFDCITDNEKLRMAKDCALHCANEFTSFQMQFSIVTCYNDLANEHQTLSYMWNIVKIEIDNIMTLNDLI